MVAAATEGSDRNRTATGTAAATATAIAAHRSLARIGFGFSLYGSQEDTKDAMAPAGAAALDSPDLKFF